ncbi:hypothetical protein GXW74_17335 [Roseomonas eburnea]|uniref:Uncharacterized protein n=1 Tax=Neoroseomonas eburnea TaxID=1346889 RepID=A0A9X9XEX2_9PROT|nr:hypothetical protein [Neoroseomonas eburnea]MBR0682258.1 hypothetical protein [Neoroseomonas eburnea]
MQPPMRAPRPFRMRAAAAALALLSTGAARAQFAADHIDITAVTVEGANAEQCTERTTRLAEQSRALSLATSPPIDLVEGLRTFYDHVLRLDANGELSSTAQLSTVYVIGHTGAGARILRAATPFIRVEVSRPEGTPAGSPSRLSISWLWLQRLAHSTDAHGRVVERPSLHRFDFVGEVVTTYGTWGHAIAPCRVGTDGLWYGAVAVWSYLPP